MLGVILVCILLGIIGLSVAWYIVGYKYVVIEITISDPWFKNIKKGKQTVIAIPYNPLLEKNNFVAAKFVHHNDIRITKLLDHVMVHPNIEDFVESHGTLRCAPQYMTKKEAVTAYHKMLNFPSKCKKVMAIVLF